jgi:hypothetical protein
MNFRCDGRTYCSQMTSCTEASWFLKNCPGVKMDGNRDGVPANGSGARARRRVNQGRARISV